MRCSSSICWNPTYGLGINLCRALEKDAARWLCRIYVLLDVLFRVENDVVDHHGVDSYSYWTATALIVRGPRRAGFSQVTW